jgi:UrcA family protein
MRKVMGSVAVAVIALTSGLASASQPLLPHVRQKAVHYSDLNLSNTAAAVTLYNRISHAAYTVCQPVFISNDETGSRHRSCVIAAIERSVVQVNATELTRYYELVNQKTPAVAMATNETAVTTRR